MKIGEVGVKLGAGVVGVLGAKVGAFVTGGIYVIVYWTEKKLT